MPPQYIKRVRICPPLSCGFCAITKVMPLFAVIVIVFQALVFFGHWFLYNTAARFLDLHGTVAVKIVFALLSVSFVSASVLLIRYNKTLLNILFTLAATWLGVFYFLVWGCFFCWIALWLHRALGICGWGKAPWAAVIFALGLAVSVFSVLNARHVRTRQISVSLPGLPAAWKGRTALWTCDLHLGPVRNIAFARRIARKIKQLNPDILFIGGDLYDGTSGDPVRLVEPFAGIKPPLGTWFITGNHEEFSPRAKQRFINAVSGAGIYVLDNDAVSIDGINIAGVDYMDTYTAEKYRAVLKKMDLKRDCPLILLKHSPMYPEIAMEEGASLQLSGHTHGGQIFPAGLITGMVYNGFDNGLKRLEGLNVYTSSGTGTWGPPMRFGTVPEIVLIRFHQAPP